MNIGKSTRVSLADVNKSKRWLAEKLEVSPSYISDVCNENTVPSIERIKQMSGIFNVKVSVFIARGEDV